jgi:hypothetical protein
VLLRQLRHVQGGAGGGGLGGVPGQRVLGAEWKVPAAAAAAAVGGGAWRIKHGSCGIRWAGYRPARPTAVPGYRSHVDNKRMPGPPCTTYPSPPCPRLKKARSDFSLQVTKWGLISGENGGTSTSKCPHSLCRLSTGALQVLRPSCRRQAAAEQGR